MKCKCGIELFSCDKIDYQESGERIVSKELIKEAIEKKELYIYGGRVRGIRIHRCPKCFKVIRKIDSIPKGYVAIITDKHYKLKKVKRK